MSFDLAQTQINQRMASMPLTSTIEPGVFDNFMRGAGMATMRYSAASASGIHLLGAVAPIVQDFTQNLLFGRDKTKAQDEYFAEHDAIFKRAVDHWTPRPGEVGVAGEVVGALLGTLPQVIASPAAAVGAFQMSQAESFVNAGAGAARANIAAMGMGAGFGVGVWMPMLGQNLWQRMLIGGAGANVAQGILTRGFAGQLLEGHVQEGAAPHAFNLMDITTDALLGLAFGSLAHVSPAQRAQGARAWTQIRDWGRRFTPQEVDSLAVLRLGQHKNADSAPGIPNTPADLQAHVDRMNESIRALVNDEPVNVEGIGKAVDRPEPVDNSGVPTDETAPSVEDIHRLATERGIPWDNEPAFMDLTEEVTGKRHLDQLDPTERTELARHITGEVAPTGPPEALQEPRTAPPQFDPRPDRERDAQAIVENLRAAADEIARDYDLPAPLRLVTEHPVYRAVKEQLEQLQRVTTEQADAYARLHTAFYDAMAKRTGRPVDDLLEAHPIKISKEPPAGTALAQTDDGWLYRYWSNRTWNSEREARDHIRRRIEEGNKQYEGLFAPNDPAIVNGLKFVAGRGGQVRLQQPRVRRTGPPGRMGTAEPPEGQKNPAVDWTARDNADDGTPHSVMKEYGRGKGVVYESWIPIDELPLSRGEDIRDGYLTEESGARDELRHRGEPPPIKVRIGPRGKVEIMDGNHRLAWWREQGYDNAPAYVIDERNNVLFQGATERSPIFYSLLERLIAAAKMEQAPAKGWKDYIRGLQQKGVKPDEVRWSGIEDWLDAQGGKVTKAQVIDFLKTGGVRVEEVMAGGDGAPNFGAPEIARHMEVLRANGWGVDQAPDDAGVIGFVDLDNEGDISSADELRRWAGGMDETDEFYVKPEIAQAATAIQAYWDAQRNVGAATKFSTYQLPGGENYRELLLTLPSAKDALIKPMADANEAWRNASEQFGPNSPEALAARAERARVYDAHSRQPENFHSSHFDTPNILAHIRFNERVDADGKKVLFVEEFQSDWAQQGKKKGFMDPAEAERLKLDHEEAMSDAYEAYGRAREIVPDDALNEISREITGQGERWVKEQWGLSDTEFAVVKKWLDAVAAERQLENEITRADRSSIPNAPFVGKTDAWVALAVKRVIRYAAEHGFERVAWTTGAQQVERYSSALRKAVDSIEWEKTPEGIHITGYKGKRSEAPKPLEFEQVDEYQGEPVYAERIEAGPNAPPIRYYVSHNPGFPWKWQGPGGTSGGGFATAEQAMADAQRHAKTLRRDGGIEPQKVVDTRQREDELSDAIGKSMAERIINDPNQKGTIEGEAINISDTGMAGFYDRIVPKVVNEVLKKLGGGKVGKTNIDVQGRPETGTGLVEQRQYEGPEFTDSDITRVLDSDRDMPVAIERQLRDMRTYLIGGGNTAAEAVARFGSISAAEVMGGKYVAKPNVMSEQAGFEITPEMRTAAMAGQPLFQDSAAGPRGYMATDEAGARTIGLLEGADPSTMIHESAHFFLEIMRDLSAERAAPAELRADMDRIMEWFGTTREAWDAMGIEERRPYHEQFARGLELFTAEGKPPTPELAGIFQRFKDWLLQVYRSLTELNVQLSPAMRDVFNRMLSGERSPAAPRDLTDPQVQHLVRGMVDNETGWAQIGGKLDTGRLVRDLGPDAIDSQGRVVVSGVAFTEWIPKAEWWRERPDKKLNEEGYRKALQKAEAGEKLRPIEQRAIDFLVKMANERMTAVKELGEDEFGLTARDLLAEDEMPTTASVVEHDQVARAMAVDEAAVERAALQHENDDAAFMAEVRRINDNASQAGEGGQADPDAPPGRRGTEEEPETGTGPEPTGDGSEPPSALSLAAEAFVAAHPERPLRVGTNADGTPVTMTARDYLDAARAAHEQATQDAPLFEAAAQCLLGES